VETRAAAARPDVPEVSLTEEEDMRPGAAL
jgi:hypothetical protein